MRRDREGNGGADQESDEWAQFFLLGGLGPVIRSER